MICSVAALGPFQSLVVVDVTIYAFALLLEFAALIALRIKHPTMKRPYKIRGGWLGMVLVTIGPLFVLYVAIYLPGARRGGGPGHRVGGRPAWPPDRSRTTCCRPGKRRKGIDRAIELEFDEPEVSA